MKIVGSLSPSRAGDFLSCPLMYRYRTIDRLPEESSPNAVRGTLVHLVLERIFDLPAGDRTPDAAHDLVAPAWADVQRHDERAREAIDPVKEEAWLASAHEVLDHWFALEDPTRLEPAERELRVEALLDDGLMLRGIVDRLDVAADGALRVVDYKAASSPAEGHEARAFFQLRLYALALWRSRGTAPRRLQLVYLGDRSEVVAEEPDENALLATQRKLTAIWAAIQEARRAGSFEPHRGRQCDWCSFKAHCPEFGGALLPMPAPPSRWARLRGRLRRRWRRLRPRRRAVDPG